MPKIAPFVEFDFDEALSKIACTKKEFLSFIDCKEITLYTWTKKRKYPYYVKLLLETALKVKELKDKALKSNSTNGAIFGIYYSFIIFFNTLNSLFNFSFLRTKFSNSIFKLISSFLVNSSISTPLIFIKHSNKTSK